MRGKYNNLITFENPQGIINKSQEAISKCNKIQFYFVFNMNNILLIITKELRLSHKLLTSDRRTMII